MAKEKDKAYISKVQGFAERMKTEPAQLSIQKIAPLNKENATKEEQQLNVWIPKSLVKRLKVKGIETDKSLKEMVIEALEQFL